MDINVAKKCPNCDYVLRVKKPQIGNTSNDPTISKEITSGHMVQEFLLGFRNRR